MQRAPDATDSQSLSSYFGPMSGRAAQPTKAWQLGQSPVGCVVSSMFSEGQVKAVASPQYPLEQVMAQSDPDSVSSQFVVLNSAPTVLRTRLL